MSKEHPRMEVIMANNIASERKRMGLKQKELASRIGASTSSVARWERNEVSPPGTALKKMHGLFGCSIDYLLGLTDERILKEGGDR